VLLGQLFFQLAKRWPQQVAHKIIAQAQVLAGPGTDIRHLTPRYKPWDQRLCLVPDGDLFTAIRQGRATVVTDQISHFTPTGLQLASGQTLAAEVIVTATGLDLLALGGMALTVDGRPVVLKDCLSYKGMMLSGVPNLAYVVG
jgi:cation diffusion facilitator CzcD-associated flavoprotein CzcO